MAAELELELFKLRDTTTGKFNSGGDYWTNRGKTWSAAGHLKTALTNHAAMILSRGKMPYSAQYTIRQDKEKLYAYLPESWAVLIVSFEGQKWVPAREFWQYGKQPASEPQAAQGE